MLLPLVENSFKHGVKGDIFQTYVDIMIKATLLEIHFEIKNNKGLSEQSETDKQGEIGLSNIKTHLNLIYPNNHVLDIQETDSFSLVKLTISNEN